jgi:hypothetical protein
MPKLRPLNKYLHRCDSPRNRVASETIYQNFKKLLENLIGGLYTNGWLKYFQPTNLSGQETTNEGTTRRYSLYIALRDKHVCHDAGARNNDRLSNGSVGANAIHGSRGWNGLRRHEYRRASQSSRTYVSFEQQQRPK